jgi:quercetin dioxygenase-like cupin family protein
MTERFWFLDTLVTMRVPHEAGTDGVSVLESRAPRGDSAPLHVHDEDEIFHLLEGEMLLRVGGADRTVKAGETLLAPAGIPHTYRVLSEEAAWLVVTARGEFEQVVRGFSRPAEHPSLPEPGGPPSAEAQARLAEVCREHGIDLVGPPLH